MGLRRNALALGPAIGLLAASVARPAAPPAAPGPATDARGVIVSCWTWGHEWGRPEMRELMASLPSIGADWVAIHPYAHVSRETGELRWRPDVEHVVRPIRWARELGLRIMIKPHVSYWGEFPWRGEIGWGGDAARWQRFRDSYRGWILHLAETCQQEGADLFVVGTELRQSQGMEEWWRGLVAEVRRLYGGRLTYAANWDDYRGVGFWDALDFVGVQAYFPLTTARSPTREQIRTGWDRPLHDLTALSRRVGRPVLFTEIGYTNSATCAERPWESHRGDGPTDVQARCLEVALEVARDTPEIAGAFIWKWFPTTQDLGPGDFTVQTPSFKALIRDVWLPRQP